MTLLPLWWGERLYGAVRQVPGVCHVATVFYQLCFVPFLPRRTYLVVDSPAVADAALAAGRAEHVRLLLSVSGHVTDAGEEFVGVRLRLSLLSVAMTVVRGLLVVALMAGMNMTALMVAFAVTGAVGVGPLVICGGATVGCGALYWLSRVATRAGPDRRAELLARLGLPEYPDAGSYTDGAANRGER